MNAIDDPVIPDDLGTLLRAASQDLQVTPAPLRSVERRVRQRRRRRRGLLATSTAVVVLLAGLAIAQIGRSDSQHDTVIATTPPAAKPDSVPQPLLLRKAPEASGLPTGPDPDQGGTLVSVTADGATEWWSTTGEWFPVGAYELADGRRFGLATTNSTGLGIPPKARLDEIGTDAKPIHSRTIPLEVPWGSFSAYIRAIGATGNELILRRDVSRQEPIDEHAFKVFTTTSYTAVDVDSGRERSLFDYETQSTYGGGEASAADDVLVRAPESECKLVVTTLAGNDARTLAGGCPTQMNGGSGSATVLAVSPDGRYVAASWYGFARTGGPAALLQVMDLDTGSSVVTKRLQDPNTIQGLSWTGVNQLTVAAEPDQLSIELEQAGVTVRTVPYDRITGAPGN